MWFDLREMENPYKDELLKKLNKMTKINFLTIANIIYDLIKSEGVAEVKKIFNFIFENYGKELTKEKIYEFSNHKQSTDYIDYK